MSDTGSIIGIQLLSVIEVGQSNTRTNLNLFSQMLVDFFPLFFFFFSSASCQDTMSLLTV